MLDYYCFMAAIVLSAILNNASAATPPYISPLQCPFPEVQTNDCPPCLKKNLCCNSECTRAVLPPKPCFALLAQLPPPMPGSYVPQCTPDGNFAPIQFWGSTGYSWCVNVATGKPLSESVRPGQQLNCSVCTEGGNQYYPGQFFNASDGYNICFCTDDVISVCTLKAHIVCPVEGQIFTPCGTARDATCNNPKHNRVEQCVAKCQCPQGTAWDKRSNKCVPPTNHPLYG